MIEPDGPSCGSSSHCRVIFSLFLLLLASSSSLPYSIQHPSKTIQCYLELENDKKKVMKSGFHLSGLMMSALVILVLWPWDLRIWRLTWIRTWSLTIRNRECWEVDLIDQIMYKNRNISLWWCRLMEKWHATKVLA